MRAAWRRSHACPTASHIAGHSATRSFPAHRHYATRNHAGRTHLPPFEGIVDVGRWIPVGRAIWPGRVEPGGVQFQEDVVGSRRRWQGGPASHHRRVEDLLPVLVCPQPLLREADDNLFALRRCGLVSPRNQPAVDIQGAAARRRDTISGGDPAPDYLAGDRCLDGHGCVRGIDTLNAVCSAWPGAHIRPIGGLALPGRGGECGSGQEQTKHKQHRREQNERTKKE